MIALKSFFVSVLLVVILASSSIARASERPPWVLVDTKKLTLTVYAGERQVLLRIRNIAIGSGATATMRRRGDQSTPLGRFHVAWIDFHSRYGIFFGLDYPTPDLARRAYSEGRITALEAAAITSAFRQHRIPPQNTALGGQLGIHGLGAGDPRLQQAVNWTDGCVAVGNREIRLLSHWLRVGSTVLIR